jgi:hypothetical protein
MERNAACRLALKLAPGHAQAWGHWQWLEIALLGNQGLDVNNPEQKYSLKALPSQFSSLQLLSIMSAAFRQIDPAMDLGMDFEAEYLAALEL